MTFLISLPVVFRSTISLNNLGELYDDLLGFGIMMVNEILKCKGQKPNSIQMFVIAIMFFKHVLSLRTILRCIHDNLSGPGVNILLHLNKVLVNSSPKNGAQEEVEYDPSLFKTSLSTLQY